VKLLLDTHTFLWFIAGDAQLDVYARQLIEEPDNERYLSVASVWEITIKSSLAD
jgi:PIN domain nuclease of toxin-antitoxin system